MVDTLANWMLRYPSLFHGLEIAAFVNVGGFFAVLWLIAFIMPGKENAYTFPRKSKARFWWRVGLLSFLALVPDYCRGGNTQGTAFTFWDGAWAIVCVSSIVYANVLGVRHYKEWKRTRPPK